MLIKNYPSTLNTFRSWLTDWNRIFFRSLEERKQVVAALQQTKSPLPLSRFPLYDPQREWELFTHFQEELKTLSLMELLSFSLIMESHALQSDEEGYPSWSRKIHVLHSTSPLEREEMVNPLLLKRVHAPLLQKMSLTEEFQFLIQDQPC